MSIVEPVRASVAGAHKQLRIVWALFLRELATRYGRDNLGFLWIVGEPLLFCGGVLFAWSLIRPPYEHGLRLMPFLFTGYLPLTLLRHVLQQSTACVRANAGLLYHRDVSLLALFVSRIGLEAIGVSLAFIIGFFALFSFHLIEAPKDMLLIYAGWFNLIAFCFGFGLIFGSLAVLSDLVEKFTSVIGYLMLPVSGAFTLVSWLPPVGQKAILTIPIVHNFEMIRAGFFGEFVETHYNFVYTLCWSAIVVFIGLLLLRFVRSRVEIE